MRLPNEARKAHTVWVSWLGHRSVPVRYAVEGEELVCFGDDGLAGVVDGQRVSAMIGDLHSGPLLVTFSATVHELPEAEVGLGLLAEVAGHRKLDMSWEKARTTRRLLALRP